MELLRPTAIGFVLLGVVSRLIPHPANFTPMGATAVFAGSYLPRPWNYITPLFILFVTDLFLGLHNTMLFVYGSFALTVFLSERYNRQPTLVKTTALGVTNALMFFVITNFGVWLATDLYPPTLAGLFQSYIMGLPFLKTMLIADIVFSIGLVGGYQKFSRSSVGQVIDRQVLKISYNLERRA